jgi:hypothetical protein
MHVGQATRQISVVVLPSTWHAASREESKGSKPGSKYHAEHPFLEASPGDWGLRERYDQRIL